MALSLVQHKSGSNSGASSLGVTVTSTGAGHLIVCSVIVVGTTPSSVSDGTSTFTQFPSARVTGSGSFAGVVFDAYYLPSSNSGKTTITVNTSAAATVIEAEVWEVSGFGTVATDGTSNNGTAGQSAGVGNSTLTGQSITTTGTSGFIAAGVGVASGSVSQNPKTSTDFDASSGDTVGTDGFCSKITASAATYTPVWTDTLANDDFLNWNVAFKDTGGGGGGGTVTVDQWFRDAVNVQRRKIGIVPAGTIGIKP